MGKYARETKVTVEKSRFEIEKILERFGADGFRYSRSDRNERRIEQIDFTVGDRLVRFVLAMPSRSDFQMTEKRQRRISQVSIDRAWDQACRQRWRTLALCIKAKLAAVEDGISEFEQEFLAHIVDPVTNNTVGDTVRPQIAQRYAGIESGQLGFPALPAPEGYSNVD